MTSSSARAERDIKQNGVDIPRAFFERALAMTAAEKKRIEKNLDLLFEFEKYVLEHPEITEKIPRNAVVFMKLAGDQMFNRWSARLQRYSWVRPGTLNRPAPLRQPI